MGEKEAWTDELIKHFRCWRSEILQIHVSPSSCSLILLVAPFFFPNNLLAKVMFVSVFVHLFRPTMIHLAECCLLSQNFTYSTLLSQKKTTLPFLQTSNSITKGYSIQNVCVYIYIYSINIYRIQRSFLFSLPCNTLFQSTVSSLLAFF